MFPLTTILIVLFSLLTPSFSARTTNPNKAPKNALLLSKISTLTLRANKLTNHRRVPAVPQLKCVGPASVCKLYTPDVLRCKNEGSGYGDEEIQWTCTASLPSEFRLGSTDVICEGYESSEDPYVLKGSCGVEYRLLLTEAGEERYGKQRNSYAEEGGEETTMQYVVKVGFWLLFIGVLLFMVAGAAGWLQGGNAAGGGGGWGGGGGGGGAWGGGNDPPPPYDYQPPRKPRTYGYSGASSRSGGSGESWRPGFWTGAATGAAAGYAAGNYGQGRRGTGGNAGEGSSSNSGGSSAPSFSSSRHESTGFGSTSRR